jgi:hypothetical protein
MFLLVVEAFKVVAECPVLVCLHLMVTFMTPEEVHFKACSTQSMLLRIANASKFCGSRALGQIRPRQKGRKGCL